MILPHLRFVENGILNETTIVKYTSDLIDESVIECVSDGIDFVEGIYLYSPEYFCPIDCHTGEVKITDNTRTIHHYSATWKTSSQKRKDRIVRLLGPVLTSWLVRLKHIFRS